MTMSNHQGVTSIGVKLNTSYTTPGLRNFQFSSIKILQIIVKTVVKDEHIRAGQVGVSH
jgi:hypothetical protein